MDEVEIQKYKKQQLRKSQDSLIAQNYEKIIALKIIDCKAYWESFISLIKKTDHEKVKFTKLSKFLNFSLFEEILKDSWLEVQNETNEQATEEQSKNCYFTNSTIIKNNAKSSKYNSWDNPIKNDFFPNILSKYGDTPNEIRQIFLGLSNIIYIFEKLSNDQEKSYRKFGRFEHRDSNPLESLGSASGLQINTEKLLSQLYLLIIFFTDCYCDRMYWIKNIETKFELEKILCQDFLLNFYLKTGSSEKQGGGASGHSGRKFHLCQEVLANLSLLYRNKIHKQSGILNFPVKSSESLSYGTQSDDLSKTPDAQMQSQLQPPLMQYFLIVLIDSYKTSQKLFDDFYFNIIHDSQNLSSLLPPGVNGSNYNKIIKVCTKVVKSYGRSLQRRHEGKDYSWNISSGVEESYRLFSILGLVEKVLIDYNRDHVFGLDHNYTQSMMVTHSSSPPSPSLPSPFLAILLRLVISFIPVSISSIF